jgi:hypothetical protein
MKVIQKRVVRTKFDICVFRFLTPPQSFITDHFPFINNNIEKSKQWKLLENPFTLDVYSKSIKTSKEARHFGIEFPGHPYEKITVENTRTITVESKTGVLLNVWYDLYDDHGSPCNEYVIVLKESNCKNIKFGLNCMAMPLLISVTVILDLLLISSIVSQ